MNLLVFHLSAGGTEHGSDTDERHNRPHRITVARTGELNV
jgi:hypothetical protein